VLFTTNGTRALCDLPPAAAAYAGALVNAAGVARAVAREHRRVAVVCAGTKAGARFTLEDLAGAGTIVERLSRASPSANLGDAALLAAKAVSSWPGGAAAIVRAARHAETIAGLGLGGDIEFAARTDTSNAVPRVWRRSAEGAELVDAGGD
jgi:phosphosulfolactate phosphohydrolase-like enzyme